MLTMQHFSLLKGTKCSVKKEAKRKWYKCLPFTLDRLLSMFLQPSEACLCYHVISVQAAEEKDKVVRDMNMLKQEKYTLQQSVDALEMDKTEMQTEKHKVSSSVEDSCSSLYNQSYN